MPFEPVTPPLEAAQMGREFLEPRFVITMRPLTEIVEQLNWMAQRSIWAGVIVRFEDGGELIYGGEGNPLHELERAVNAGGRIIGFVSLANIIEGTCRLLIRPLSGSADGSEDRAWLEGIQNSFLDWCRERGILAHKVCFEWN